jgi:hypothetical protein
MGLQYPSRLRGLPRLPTIDHNMLNQSNTSSGFVGAVLGRSGGLI